MREAARSAAGNSHAGNDVVRVFMAKCSRNAEGTLPKPPRSGENTSGACAGPRMKGLQMRMIRPFRTSAARLAVLTLTLLPAAAAANDDLPRYDLPVGRVLSYSHQSEAKKEDGAEADGTRSDLRATV